jgi:tetratricopeptide (TPR) repeat protein
MWVELYPENTLARRYLAAAYTQLASRTEDAIGQLQIAYELDPGDSKLLLWMARLHEVSGDVDLAMDDYILYSEQNPEDPEPLVEMAVTLANTGKLTEARENYERAELIDPELISAQIGLADLAVREGRYDRAQGYLSYAESISMVPQQEALVIRGWINYYQTRGQIAAVLDLVDRLYQVEQSFVQPINLLMLTYVQYAAAYAEADQVERGQSILTRLQAGFEPPLDGLADVGLMHLWVAAGDPEKGLEYTDKVDDFLQLIQQERYVYVVEMSRARLAALNGDLDQSITLARNALERFDQFLLGPEDELDRIRITLDLSELLIEAGKPDNARQLLTQLLVSNPAHPIANLLLARADLALGDTEQARAALQKTLHAYADADRAYPPAVEARELEQIL